MVKVESNIKGSNNAFDGVACLKIDWLNLTRSPSQFPIDRSDNQEFTRVSCEGPVGSGVRRDHPNNGLEKYGGVLRLARDKWQYNRQGHVKRIIAANLWTLQQNIMQLKVHYSECTWKIFIGLWERPEHFLSQIVLKGRIQPTSANLKCGYSRARLSLTLYIHCIQVCLHCFARFEACAGWG